MRSKNRIPAGSASATSIVTLTLLATTTLAHAGSSSLDNVHLLRRQSSTLGCYSSSAPLSNANPYDYQTASYCSNECFKMGKAVAATQGKACLCGDQIPASSSKTDDSKCDIPCPGYGQQTCGGTGTWTVYLSGTNNDPGTYDGSSSSSSSSSSSTSSTSSSSTSTSTSTSTTSEPATVVTSEVAGGHTIFVTTVASSGANNNANDNSNNNGGGGGGGGSNTAGIAAGVVVGVVALAAIVGGLFFFLRHKKRKEAAAAYQQQSQVAEFVRGGHHRGPFAHGYSTSSDQRLDPEAGRRNSVGSLADSEDYSRKILRVANPDSS